MAQYHVGCGIAGIYAGTLKKSGDEWLNKNDVTTEAVNAVAQYMYHEIPEGENKFGYIFTLRSGERIKLIVEKVSADGEKRES